ncbi:nuclear transport factor 2 family protein [Novosphingobium sp. Chol11]|uniref:nuclear transport factor 2 family protein n=1 Tax=Novosphingobium sp. Chol11 TaxID=1385763 RepID=UPI0025F75AB8|nr:nuclear transport factor 2 family protein [Novosphingobium sp. Chol11]
MASSDEFAAALRQVADRQAIAHVICQLARGIDRRDKRLIDDCFHEDATDDHGIFKGTARAFSEWVMVQLASYVRTQHIIANQIIEIDGDKAACESYFHAHHVMHGGEGEINLVVAGRYLDRLERRANVWKIAHRGVVYDWNRIDPSTDGWKVEPIASLLARGRASAEDPSYALFDPS